MARVQEGDVTMRSDPAEGTTLTLTLRALGAEQLPPPPPPLVNAPLGAPAAAAPVEAADFAPRRVLVADDDEYNRLLLRRYLPTPPFTVEAVAHGQAAVEAITRQWPDIVLIDMEMPVMNGVEAVTWMRNEERRRGRPPCVIVMLSSNDDEFSIRKGMAAGCNRYLTKPVTREALLAVMHDLDVAGHSGPQPLAAEAGPVLAPGEAQPPVAASAPVQVEASLRDEVPGFLQSRHELLDAMDAALARGDLAEVRELAHKATGGLALFGFAWAAWQGRRIEMRAARGARLGLQEEIGRLRAHLREVRVL